MRVRAKVAVMAAMSRGQKLLAAGKVAESIECFDRAVALDPHCAQALLYRAGLHLLTSEIDRALDDFRVLATIDHSRLPRYRDLTTPSAEDYPILIEAADRAVLRDPSVAWAHVFRAFSKRSLMRYEEAVEDLDRALACEPKSAALWAMRSRVKLTNYQDRYKGVQDMEKAVELAPDWGWLHCWLGEALRHDGDFKRALKHLDRGLTLDPAYLRGYAWRGGVLVALGRWRDAIRSLDRSLAWDPIYSHDFEYTFDQKSWAHNQRMLAFKGLGDTASALKALQQAHRFGPRYAWVFNPKGEAKVYEAGLAELDAFLAKRPRHAWARAWKGWTLQQAGRLEEALVELQAARRAEPGRGWVWCWEGRVLLQTGRPAEAERAISRGLALDPDYAPAWGWRGEARRALRKFKPAISDFERAVLLDHRCAWGLAAMGECKLRLGRVQDALHDLDRALGIHPRYAEGLAWRAEARRVAGRLQDALRDADEALRLKPGLVPAYISRSLIKQALRDYEGQLADMRKAAQLAPELAEKARELAAR